MAQSDRTEVLRANERIKHFTTVVSTLSNALIIATAGRMWLNGTMDLWDALWLIVGVLTILLASYSLTQLEAEPKDE